MQNTEKLNKMGEMPEMKLLLTTGIPLMVSMLVAALYNIVDTYFVSQMEDVGEAAANALSLAFPVQMVMTALNVGTGVGVGAALSRALGQNNFEKASKIAGNAMFLYGVYYVVMLLFGLFLARPFISLFTDDAQVAELGVTYLRCVTCFSFGNMGEKCFEKLLQSTGKTAYSMIGQLTGSLLNVILDPIFIFGRFGVPAMGVAGAAIATVIGQCCAIAITATLHFKINTEIKNHPKDLLPDKSVLKEVMKVGAPAIVMQGLTSVTTLGMNFILTGISASAVTAYGIYYKLQNFVFMPAFGINNACVPIIGYNIGAKNKKRVKNTIRYSVIIVLVIMILGTALFRIFAKAIVGIFALSDEFTAICVTAMRVIALGFVFAGVNVLLQGVCQAMGGGVVSLVISALRLVVLALPLVALFSRLPNAETFVWAAFPVAEVLTFAVAVVFTRKLYLSA